MQVLPDVNPDQWTYDGEAEVTDQTVHNWVFKSEPGQGYGHYVSNYTLSVTKVPRCCSTSAALLEGIA